MQVKTKTTWILVADGARALIFEQRGPGEPLQPVSDRCFAEARKPTREIGADRPGRVHDSRGTTRHGMAARVDWHRFAKETFAKSVAGALEDAAKRREFEQLILVAPPRTLGDLRGALGRHAQALVTGEIGKDLTNLSVPEITFQLDQARP